MKFVITGAAGQDGVIMSRRLISQGHEVYGLCKKSQMDYLVLAVPGIKAIEFQYENLTELTKTLNSIEPDVIVNLAGFSSVWRSWSEPAQTFSINTVIPMNIMEWILKNSRNTKFLQASSSEIFGGATSFPQNEDTPLAPITPYGNSKATVHQVLQSYRRKEGLHFSSAILYNHESPLRKIDFVTKHIVNSVAKIKLGLADNLVLGNIEMSRDWGWAPDYVDGMLLVLNKLDGRDYLFASGVSHKVKDFVDACFREVGILNFDKYLVSNKNNDRKVDPTHLVGDASRARKELGWNPTIDLEGIIKKMMDFELASLTTKSKEIWFE